MNNVSQEISRNKDLRIKKGQFVSKLKLIHLIQSTQPPSNLHCPWASKFLWSETGFNAWYHATSGTVVFSCLAIQGVTRHWKHHCDTWSKRYIWGGGRLEREREDLYTYHISIIISTNIIVYELIYIYIQHVCVYNGPSTKKLFQRRCDIVE